MSAASETPSLAQLLREHADATIGRLSIHLPGLVVSYDGATQTADVQPLPAARRRVPDSPDLEPLVLPQLSSVPVLWPSWAGGAAAITGALQAGDYVLLLICDRSIDEWREAVQKPYTPRDIRRCNLSDAMCFPGGRPPASPLDASKVPLLSDPPGTTVFGGSLKLGSSTAVDRVVTETRLLGALQTLITQFNSHTHLSASVGSPTGTPALSTPPTVMTVPAANSLSSADVKAT